MLAVVAHDPYLQPYEAALQARHDYALHREQELCQGRPLSDWADGYLYYGLHLHEGRWILREWAPNATAIYLIGDTNQWQRREEWKLKNTGDGNWEGSWPQDWLSHGQLYKLLVEWPGGSGERLPAYATRVVQDCTTRLFSAQIWSLPHTPPAQWPGINHAREELYIYECHVGMATEEQRVGTYEEFRLHILPRVAELGYNCLQLMAIQEHPYYGSFGYHVTNFFAPSSRSGTPDELRALIADAHSRGIAVIMDLVHSHAAKNEQEGLARQDGTGYQYFHAGSRREHPAWDSLCFDYGKPQVLHFLLSNCKYWMEEFGFDGFRFDGVTSMMYLSHGLGEDFTDYNCYFNGNEDGDALCYLTLANRMIHQLNPRAITIAEDMSGMPGLASGIEQGGIGFDYRLQMGVPDFWIKYIKEVRDEDWHAGHIYYELTNRRQDERTITYAESHDQALVGDKTIIFRLMDSDMYWHMEHGHATFAVDRGLALTKMIRLITASTSHGGYLNFMGNEFGHPEWIDFPREGNGWSHLYARRQWSLAEHTDYYYSDLNRFDHDMIHLLRSAGTKLEKIWDRSDDQVIAYRRGNLVFVFNWNGQQSYTDYGIPVKPGKYKVVMNTDSVTYGGHGLSDDQVEHFTQPDPLYLKKRKGWLHLYLPARSAVVLKMND